MKKGCCNKSGHGGESHPRPLASLVKGVKPALSVVFGHPG